MTDPHQDKEAGGGLSGALRRHATSRWAALAAVAAFTFTTFGSSALALEADSNQQPASEASQLEQVVEVQSDAHAAESEGSEVTQTMEVTPEAVADVPEAATPEPSEEVATTPSDTPLDRVVPKVFSDLLDPQAAESKSCNFGEFKVAVDPQVQCKNCEDGITLKVIDENLADEYFVTGFPDNTWKIADATSDDISSTDPLMYRVSGAAAEAGLVILPPEGYVGEPVLQVLKANECENLVTDFDQGKFDFIGDSLPQIASNDSSGITYTHWDPTQLNDQLVKQYSPWDGQYSIWPTATMNGPENQYNNQWADLRSTSDPLSVSSVSLWSQGDVPPSYIPEQVTQNEYQGSEVVSVGETTVTEDNFPLAWEHDGWHMGPAGGWLPADSERQSLTPEDVAGSGKILVVNGKDTVKEGAGSDEVIYTTVGELDPSKVYLAKVNYANVSFVDWRLSGFGLEFFAGETSIGKSESREVQPGWANKDTKWSTAAGYIKPDSEEIRFAVNNFSVGGDGNDFAIDNLGLYPTEGVAAKLSVQPGALTWQKVDSNDESKLLAGSVWQLTGTETEASIEDCVADSAPACEGLDKDPAAGRFKVEDLACGDYSIKETKAPEGYEIPKDAKPVSGSIVGTDDVANLTVDLGKQSNRLVPKWTLSKTSDPVSGSTVKPGDTITYTVKAKSLNDAEVRDVVVTDDLSEVLKNATVTGIDPADGTTAQVKGTTLTWTVGTLKAKSEQTLTYTVKVNEGATGVTIGNVVSGESGDVPPELCTPEEPCATEHFTPKWTLVKSSDPASGATVLPGQVVEYTLTAANVSDVTLSGAKAIDNLAEVLNNATLVEPLDSALKLEGNTLTWSIPAMAPNQNASVKYSVKVNKDALGVTVGNVVTGEGIVPPEPCETEDPKCRETEHHTPQWTLAKASDPASGQTILPGSSVTYTLTAKNTSAVDVTNLVVTDSLADVLNNAVLTAGPTADLGEAKVEGGKLTWSIPSLPKGKTAIVTYTVKVNADALGVSLKNVVTGTGVVPPTDCTPEEPCETNHKTPAVWSLSKTSDPISGATVKPGDVVTYTVTATNSSKKAVSGVVVKDDLSEVLNNATMVGEAKPSVGEVVVKGKQLTWNLGDLGANSKETLTYQVKINADAYGVTIGNTVSGESSDVPPEECTAEAPCETTHNTDPIWTLVKSSDPDSGSTVKPGSDIKYTVTVKNPSKSSVKDLVIVDDLSDVLNHSVVVVEPKASEGTAAVKGNQLSWSIPELSAGKSATVSYTVKVNEDSTGVTLRNVVTSEGKNPPQPCEVEDPNCRETEHHIPQWTLVKDSDPSSGSTVLPGSEIVYTLTAKNTSEVSLEGAKATDDLSKVLNNAVLVGPLAEGLSVKGNTLSWAIPTLAPGAEAKVSYTVKVNEDATGVTIGNVVTGEGIVPPQPCEVEDPKCRETEHHTPAWSLEKTSDPVSGSTVVAGQKVKYTLKATNTSDAVVEGAIAVDDMSKVLDKTTLVEPLAKGLTLQGTNLSWALPTLKPGESAEISYTVKVKDFNKKIQLLNVVAPKTPGGECVPGKCSTEHPGKPGGELPKTGAQVVGIAAAGVALLSIGGAAMIISKRRRNI